MMMRPINLQKINHSFIELLKDKKYSQISIKDITDKAKVSRRTFYQYYENKQQLYEEVVGDFIEWSLKPFEKNEDNQVFSAKIEHFPQTLIENLELVECLFDADCPQVLANIIEKILTNQIQEEQSGFFINKLSLLAAQRYYVEIVSQNCCSSINYVLHNKHLSKDELIKGLCDACDAISYFYRTDH
ncbi:MAG: TetR/AcrR family transcriptional regulator [Erysipelotrichia bacterium]|nr:TetR/AcrR family transcriptional regulator [Erysipelotrichia bacterium]